MRPYLLALALGNFAMGVDTFVIAPILEPMAADLGVGRASAGQLVTAYALAYAIGGPMLAAIVGNRAPRRLLLWALAVFAVGNALTAIATTLPVAGLSRVIAGAGGSMYSANALALVRRREPDRPGRAVAVVVSGLTTAIVFGLPLGAWLGNTTNWRVTIWLIVALTALAAVAVALVVPTVDGVARVRLRARLAPFADRRVLVIAGSTALCLGASWTVYSYIDEVLRPATGGDAGRVALALLCFGGGAVMGNLVSGWLADRFTPGRTIAVAAPLLIVAVVAIPWAATTLPAAFALAAGWGALHWTVNVPQQLRVVAAAPDAAPLVLGLHQSAIYVGISIGGGVGAAGLDAGGRTGVGYAAGAVGLVALALLVASFRPVRTPVPDRTPARL